MKHVYDKGENAFKYTPSGAHQTTDYLREKFARIRAEMAANKQEAESKVKPIIRAKRMA